MFVLQYLRGRGRKRGFFLSFPCLFTGERVLLFSGWRLAGRKRKRIFSPQKSSEEATMLEDQGEMETRERRERTGNGVFSSSSFFSFFPLSSLFLSTPIKHQEQKRERTTFSLQPLFPSSLPSFSLFRETNRL